MLYSRLFGKTHREPRSDMKLISHKLLYQAGFVSELSAGRYEYLPLGFIVWQKIINIIDEEMKAIGSQRISIPLLHPMEIWKKTNRDKAWGNLLMKLEDARGSEFALSATGEGVITDMVTAQNPSYKDLPIILHQTINKFRDEMRVRGGLLRLREFTMKDAYSYNATEEDFMKTYNDFYKAYGIICDRLELEYRAVIADSGALGGDYSHEFQIECESGEDQIITCEKCEYAANIEKAEFVREKVNQDEELNEMKIVDQKWEEAQSIQEMVQFYGKPANNMIKTIVYKRPDGRLVLGVVTGNLAVNPIKLAHAVGENELTQAEKKDLDSIGAIAGAVHAWGYEEHKDNITFVVDHSIVNARNLFGGFKTKTNDPRHVNYGRDFKHEIEADIADPYNDAQCSKCSKKLKLTKTIEFGHIFKYDHFYTEKHDGFFTDKDGSKKLMYMGAYGIGIDRAIATIVEKHHDDHGIIWPAQVAPYTVHLIGLDLQDVEIKEKVEKLYHQLLKAEIEVLYDDRDEARAGEKFATADLIGNPIRLVISKRTGDQVEWKRRSEKESKLISVDRVIKKIKELNMSSRT
ncbi:proline--tRNA ligase [Candidatus Roizmanbacteria bacterium CG10_big_fil_rev_8_21_14_0_10_39_12]|uniref:Proline--tRNA ligase n=1 Tax=Candidatus Roizmanbacteria bacterium CG10_big_fil_rev_8_21_14_0_10_39_12 TaxID=1974852 RepID=A0A2M8KP57_9BACT|nr:MAG: proline--tRNA ligase [Candidatus Roizmanbacteria bacterium CG10_big_fil_rev_8_21_14_0_10_39_12]